MAAPIIGHLLLSWIKIENCRLTWIHSKITEVLTATIINLKDILYLLKVTALGIVILILTVIAHYILFKGFGIILTVPALLVFYVLLRLSLFIIITPGNIGVQEIAYGFISEQMGFGMAQGVLVSVFSRILNTSVILVLGILFGGIDLLRHRKNYQPSDK